MFLDKIDVKRKALIFTKFAIGLSLTANLTAGHALTPVAYRATITQFPVLTKLQSQGKPLASETIKWMERWRGVNLENPVYKLDQLSGSSGVYLKIRKPDPTDKDGYKAYGTFASSNSSGNPYSEVAYFNLAAIMGYDHIFRSAIPYALGPKASQVFKTLLENTDMPEAIRLENKNRILQEIATGKPLKGCIKAKKKDTYIAYDDIANTKAPTNGIPRPGNPIIIALQAGNPLPIATQTLDLVTGYKGNLLQLAREYSVIMTLDTIFQQWDRYSGANVVIAKDATGAAHFYSTDNGGASLETDPFMVLRNLKWFSRYDRKTINQLKGLYAFLVNPSKGFLGYNNAEAFVVDLGLYDGLKPSEYVEILKRNLRFLFIRVAKVEQKFGEAAYLP